MYITYLKRMCLCLVLLLLLAVLYVNCSLKDETLDIQWEQWKIKYKKKYNDEEDYRRTIWEQNMYLIEVHNCEAEQGKHSYKLGMNYLTDMTSEEVAEKLTCLKPHRAKFSDFSRSRKCYLQSRGSTGPDWSTNRMGSCGACWVFSATGAIEGQLAKKTGRLLDLSAQNLLDCVDNNGCNGGHIIDAFEYVQKNGINSEEDYPYVIKKQSCRFNSSAIAAQCKGYRAIPEGDEYELAEALVEVGPLSVAIDSRNISIYTSGVYYNPQCDKDNPGHAVLLVGYGETAEGEKYWIVKNSWGDGWGEKGYIRIARNRENHCGIATDATYPLM
ncbi:cathepsin K-like isoform X2 [Anabas testudineus]|uniref:cathepsin K-like isoform X2 n=1 Tax=Anabas testudineus TaxID=64144 RepID=UPI000E460992|nr:cathepsin K-like isoform X2 [Anabas testudineus]